MSGGTTPERPRGTTIPEPLHPLLVTDSGTFHLDGAFAYAVLRLALGLGEASRDQRARSHGDEGVRRRRARLRAVADPNAATRADTPDHRAPA